MSEKADKSIVLWREWLDDQPMRLQAYIKNRCMEKMHWTVSQWLNKNSRTAWTAIEMEKANDIFQEQIFTVEKTELVLKEN